MWGIDEEEVKKRVYLASTSSEEVNCSSGPLTGKLLMLNQYRFR